MNSELVIVPVMLITLFGIVYLFVNARHRERMALIEKGADASIFYSGRKKEGQYGLLKLFVLNLSFLLIGIGLGICTAGILAYNLNVRENIAFPGTIFLFSGAGLYMGFRKSLKLQ